MVIGDEMAPWKMSPTWAFSELTSSLVRMLICVPDGTVIFVGPGGVAGAEFWVESYEELLPALLLAVVVVVGGTVVRSPLSPPELEVAGLGLRGLLCVWVVVAGIFCSAGAAGVASC